MSDTLTIIFENNSTLEITTPTVTNILEIVTEEPDIIEVIVEGPTGPPDTRPRPSDIAFNVFGEFEPNELLVRLELAAPITIVPQRCKASAEAYPDPDTEILVTHESNGINTTIAVVEFMSNNTASISFPSGLNITPGIIRVRSTNSGFGLKDFSITISGDR